MFHFALAVIFTLLQCVLVNSENILAINAVPSHSHYIWHEKYLLELVNKGYNVTVLTYDDSTTKNAKYTVITFEGIYEKARASYNLEDFINYGPMDTMGLLWDYSHFTCEESLKTKGLKTILNYPDNFKFDLIIFDIHSGQCLYPLIKKFNNPPVIATSPFGYQHVIADTLKQHIHSYIPYFMNAVSDRMTFWQRLKNLFYIISLNVSRKLYFIPSEYNSALKRFGQKITSDFEELERNISLVLVNSDNFLNYPQVYAPNVIPVGGLHIEKPKKLPGDLEKYFSNDNGVILLSLGSDMQLNYLKNDVLVKLLKVLEKLPFTVLTKCLCENVKLPKNVIAKEWLPQNDILGHNQTVLLLSHGGTLSLQEAMYHGVPVVGMPFYLNQHANLAVVEDRKIGIKLDFDEFSFEELEESIQEVISNPIYSINARSLSKLYKDRPVNPLNLAIYWTEYMLKHGTASHFDIAARDLNFIQSSNLDILLVVSLIVFSVLFVSYATISRILKKARPLPPPSSPVRSPPRSPSKSNQNGEFLKSLKPKTN